MNTAQILLVLSIAMGMGACTQQEFSLEAALPVNATKGLKYGDHDPVPIKGKQPKTFAIHGIDISRYNPAIDWAKAERAGIRFAFIKATEGQDDRDPSFAKWWSQAGKSRIQRSAYHFYYFCAGPENQAKNYINAVPKSQASLPPVLDVEWNPTSPTCKTRPPAAKVVADLQKWLTIVERHYGQKPIIYTTVDFYADNLSRGELPGYQYWLRSVKAEPRFIYKSRPWVFWQYTGTGSVPGIKGPVDINVFNGSQGKWQSWVARNRR